MICRSTSGWTRCAQGKKGAQCGRTYPALYRSICDDATQMFLSIRCDDDNCGRENKWWFDIVVRRNTINKLLGWKMCLRASSHYVFRCTAQSVRHQVILQLTFYTLSSRHGWFGLFERIVEVVIIMSALRHTIRCIHYSPKSISSGFAFDIRYLASRP